LKNQYFGDINDYKKYGLIRLLGGMGRIKTAVCWMLTPDDPRPDGHRIQYLFNPDKWRRYDSEVFDYLYNYVIEEKSRNIYSLEKSKVIPNCSFYSEIIKDDPISRNEYMQKFLNFSKHADLVFFDPDNGMEVKSVPFGRARSSKYLYFPEVEKTFSAGHSLLIYQHLPPKPRDIFINSLAKRLCLTVGINRLYLYRTQFVVFFLIPQLTHNTLFSKANERVEQKWANEIEIIEYLI
jgi:hypothetical protein